MTWVARIAIDRPERMNAFDIDTHEEFLAAIDRVENDDDIQVAVITGTGQRAFCSGRDLKWTAQVRRASDKARADVDRRMAALMRLQFRADITKPLLARANGVALGGGLEPALACDIIAAADHVEMGLPEARRAFIAGAMGIHSLPRQLPHHLAMGFLLTGRHFSAPKAAELGLVNQVTPMEELESAQRSDQRSTRFICLWLTLASTAGQWNLRGQLAQTESKAHEPLLTSEILTGPKARPPDLPGHDLAQLSSK